MDTVRTEPEGGAYTSPEFETLAFLAEAYLEAAGREEGLVFMRKLAGLLNREPENVVSLTGGREGAKNRRIARTWLSRALSAWLAQHG